MLVLNGKSIKLTGGSVHHDNGPLGAAAFDRAEERRVELLKAAGYNAVRTAHNPPSPEFLDACDRIGILVLDEPFDVWTAHKVKFDYATYFDDWWKRDIDSMVLRDRNHPSIVIWGIGNEIPELETEKGRVIGKQLADEVRSLDNTRPLTLAFPGTTTAPNAEAVFSLLDITGYNYNILPTYAEDHKKLPSRIMLTTESLPSKAYPLWKVTQENAYVLGDLTWTAMDYLGESGIGAWSYGTPEQAKTAEQMMGSMMGNTAMIDKMFLGMANGVDVMAEMAKGGNSDPAAKAAMAVMFHGFPWHAANCGDIDLTGYRKPQSYYRDILWNGGDRVYATVRLPEPEGKKIIAVGWAVYPTLPSWTWPGREGKDMQVEVYAGTEKVRLYLNDKLVGEMPTGVEQQRKAVFSVPYAPGTLKAVGVNGDREVATSVLETAGEPVKLRLTADRSTLHADGEDLSFVTVEAVDAQGRVAAQCCQRGAIHDQRSGNDYGRGQRGWNEQGVVPGGSQSALRRTGARGGADVEDGRSHSAGSQRTRHEGGGRHDSGGGGICEGGVAIDCKSGKVTGTSLCGRSLIMADTFTIDPAHTAVLSMDCQAGIVSIYTREGKDAFLVRVASVLNHARAAGMTVIHVQVGFRPKLPEIHSRNALFGAVKSSEQHQRLFREPLGAIPDSIAPQDDEIVITKHRISAFAGTDLAMILRANDIDTLVLYGISTSGVVLSTLIEAADADYRLAVIGDCCADLDSALHDCLIQRFFPARGTVLSSEGFIAASRRS